MAGLNATQMRGLTAGAVSDLARYPARRAGPTQIGELTVAALGGLSADQMAALTVSQIAGLGALQIGGLGIDQIGDLIRPTWPRSAPPRSPG